MNYIDTIQKAEQARKLFRGGESNKEILEALKISKATYHRYWKILGGKKPEDLVEHYKNK